MQTGFWWVNPKERKQDQQIDRRITNNIVTGRNRKECSGLNWLKRGTRYGLFCWREAHSGSTENVQYLAWMRNCQLFKLFLFIRISLENLILRNVKSVGPKHKTSYRRHVSVRSSHGPHNIHAPFHGGFRQALQDSLTLLKKSGCRSLHCYWDCT